MRLWHKNLIPVLPRQQLLGQWRECCLIAKNISEKGTPNHILVNKIMDYPIEEFINYAYAIYWEMDGRGYNVDYSKFLNNLKVNMSTIPYEPVEKVFYNWHDVTYLRICYYNLFEKYLCGGISDEEWQRIENYYDLYFKSRR